MSFQKTVPKQDEKRLTGPVVKNKKTEFDDADYVGIFRTETGKDYHLKLTKSETKDAFDIVASSLKGKTYIETLSSEV